MVDNIDIEVIICKLLHGLKAKGFSIGTDAYIKTTQLLYWFLREKKADSIASFSLYLAPVICKSDEEQDNFKKIFSEIFLGNFEEFEKKLRLEEDEKRKMQMDAKKGRRKKWRQILSVILFLIALILAGKWYFNRPPRVILDFSKQPQQPLFFNKNKEVPISHSLIFNHPADTSKFEVEYTFSRSGESRKGVSILHMFRHYGKDTVSVRLKSLSFNIDTTLIYTEVYVGPENKLSITPEKENLVSGEENSYTASIDSSINTRFYWGITRTTESIEMKKDSFINNPIKYFFKDTGTYLITVKYDVQKDGFLQKFPEEYISALYIQKVMPQGMLLTSVANQPQPVIKSSVNKIWAVSLSALMVLLLYAMFRSLRNKTHPVIYKEDDFKGDKPPYDLHFVSKEQNIHVGYALLRLSNDLKKRVESSTFTFDISKTIRQSMLNRGFITPGFTQKQTNREYLFLIDQASANSQQMKLFSFLARFFIDHMVKLDFYFYHQTPDQFYRSADGPRIKLENIKDRYYHSALILFADGANFIDYDTVKLRDKITGGFTYWPNRVLITPVPFIDWARNEKILSSFFNLLPADIIGLLELIRAIDTDTSEKLFLGQFNTYESKYVDFNNMDALREYLSDDELFQWICALAVHPKIYWEVTLEIGKIIVKDQTKINYDTLLKLARIRWISEGTFTPSTRLELLKKLTNENEIKARECLLKMLDEVPTEEEIFSYEEKLLSRCTSSFVLFSTGKEKYTSDEKMQEGAEKFLSLYKTNRILDNPFKIYVEKRITATDHWDTPITTEMGNVGIEAYIQEKENAKSKADRNERMNRNKIMARFLVGAASLLFLLGYLFFNKDAVARSNMNQYLHLADTIAVIDNTIRLNISTSGCFRNLLLLSKDTFATVEVRSGKSILSTNKIKFTDSALIGLNYKGLLYDSTKEINCKLIFDNGQSFETAMPLLPVIYDIALVGCPSPKSLDTVYYFPGEGEDTTLVLMAVKAIGYEIIVRSRNSNRKTPVANVISFDKQITNNEKFAFGDKLLQAGFPLKAILVNASENATKNIEIRGEEGADHFKIMTADTLKCLLGLGACATTEKSLLRLFFSTGISTGKVNKLTTCLKNAGFDINSKNLPGSSISNQVWYFSDSFKDSANLLLACLKTYFPDRSFKMLKKSGSPKSMVAAEIYLYDTIIQTQPIVIMNISEERLRPGVNSIRDELTKNGFAVSPAQVRDNIAGNTLTYSDNSLKDEAEIIKRIYDKHFAGIPIDVKYFADPLQRKTLTISIVPNQVNPAPDKITINNVKFPAIVAIKSNFNITFNILSGTSNGLAATQLDGKICLSEALAYEQRNPDNTCTNFKFAKTGVSNVSEMINTSNLRAGRYSVKLSATAPKTDTLLGYVTIEEPVKPPIKPCDTIHSYVGLGKDNVLFKGQIYINLPLKERGFEFSLTERNAKYGSFTLAKDKCPVETLILYIDETKTIELCDGTQIKLTMLNWENKKGKVSNKEAIFDAVICNPVKQSKK